MMVIFTFSEIFVLRHRHSVHRGITILRPVFMPIGLLEVKQKRLQMSVADKNKYYAHLDKWIVVFFFVQLGSKQIGG
jgi:hypothetical protein